MAEETTAATTTTAETTASPTAATDTTTTEAAATTAATTTESLLTGEAGTEETKAPDAETAKDPKAAEEKGKEGPPEKYEFTAPEGVTLDPAALAQFEPLARELGLTQEAAQKIVGLQASIVKAQQEAYVQQQHEWIASVKADAEVGGQNFHTAIRQANVALNKFGGKPLIEALAKTGMANHPELVRTFARIGKAIGEDTFHQPDKSPGQPRDLAKILFPNNP